MRPPHVLRTHEIARIVAEHAGCVLVLLAAQVVGSALREVGGLDALLSPAGWPEVSDAVLRQVRLVERGLGAHLAWSSFAVASLQYSMFLHGLYSRQPVRTARRRLLLLVRSATVAALLLALVVFLARPRVVGRATLVAGFSLAVVLLWAVRSAWHRAARPRAERVLVLGGGEPLRQVLALEGGPGLAGFDLAGRIGDEDTDGRLPRLGGWNDLEAILSREQPDRLLLASSRPGAWDVSPVVAARLHGVQVGTAREFAEGLSGQVLESDIGEDFVTLGTAKAYGRVSRLLDAVLAALLLVLLSPLLVAVAAAVLVFSGRPVLFRQERVGQAERTYACWKFRTMTRDAERDGPAWSPEDDRRITGVGRFLRRWRLDELPQLWNVLAGDMSFVGPRPEQPFFVAQLRRALPHYSLRHVVRPGLTGWAQVRHSYGSTEEDARMKLRFDLFYIKHRSPYLDLAILFDTLRIVLTGRGR